MPHIFRAGETPGVMETAWGNSAEQMIWDSLENGSCEPYPCGRCLGLTKETAVLLQEVPWSILGALAQPWCVWGLPPATLAASLLVQHPSPCKASQMRRSNSLTGSDRWSQNHSTSPIIHMENQNCFFHVTMNLMLPLSELYRASAHQTGKANMMKSDNKTPGLLWIHC